MSTDSTASATVLSAANLALVRTVILAGGMGTRLRPYTSILPKPLLPLGDRSILELLMKQLSQHGFRDIGAQHGRRGGPVAPTRIGAAGQH